MMNLKLKFSQGNRTSALEPNQIRQNERELFLLPWTSTILPIMLRCEISIDCGAIWWWSVKQFDLFLDFLSRLITSPHIIMASKWIFLLHFGLTYKIPPTTSHNNTTIITIIHTHISLISFPPFSSHFFAIGDLTTACKGDFHIFFIPIPFTIFHDFLIHFPFFSLYSFSTIIIIIVES